LVCSGLRWSAVGYSWWVVAGQFTSCCGETLTRCWQSGTPTQDSGTPGPMLLGTEVGAVPVVYDQIGCLTVSGYDQNLVPCRAVLAVDQTLVRQVSSTNLRMTMELWQVLGCGVVLGQCGGNPGLEVPSSKPVTKKASEQASERANEQASEKASNKHSAIASEKASQQVSKNASDKEKWGFLARAGRDWQRLVGLRMGYLMIKLRQILSCGVVAGQWGGDSRLKVPNSESTAKKAIEIAVDRARWGVLTKHGRDWQVIVGHRLGCSMMELGQVLGWGVVAGQFTLCCGGTLTRCWLLGMSTQDSGTLGPIHGTLGPISGMARGWQALVGHRLGYLMVALGQALGGGAVPGQCGGDPGLEAPNSEPAVRRASEQVSERAGEQASKKASHEARWGLLAKAGRGWQKLMGLRLEYSEMQQGQVLGCEVAAAQCGGTSGLEVLNSEPTAKRANKQARVRACEQASEKASQKASKNVSEQAGDRASEQASQKASKNASKDASDTPPRGLLVRAGRGWQVRAGRDWQGLVGLKIGCSLMELGQVLGYGVAIVADQLTWCWRGTLTRCWPFGMPTQDSGSLGPISGTLGPISGILLSYDQTLFSQVSSAELRMMTEHALGGGPSFTPPQAYGTLAPISGMTRGWQVLGSHRLGSLLTGLGQVLGYGVVAGQYSRDPGLEVPDSEPAAKKASEQAGEGASEQASQKASKKASEKESKKTSDSASDKAREQASKKASDEAGWGLLAKAGRGWQMPVGLRMGYLVIQLGQILGCGVAAGQCSGDSGVEVPNSGSATIASMNSK
jgi:hypothetical protein